MLIAKGRLKKTFVHYLMRLVTPSPNRDEDKPETFNAFFTSVFNTDAQSPGLEDHKTGRDKLPLDFELTQNLLLQLNAQKVHGTWGDSSQGTEEFANVIARPISVIYQQPREPREVPVDQKLENVTQIFKKGKTAPVITGLSVSFWCLVKLWRLF